MQSFFEVIRLHWGMILTFAGFVGCVVRLSMDNKYIRKDEIIRLKQTVGRNEQRLEALEVKVQDLPTASDLSDIKILMTKLDGKIDKIGTKLEGVSHQTRLLIEKEVNSGG